MATERCGKVATTLVYWPGSDPRPMCDDHAKDAEKVADAMGFYINTPSIDHDAVCTSSAGRVQEVKI